MNRRQFLKLVGATGALAAAGACDRGPVERLIPFVIPPEDIVPGIPVWYTTTCRECNAGCGMLVRTREGRAVKVEGLPDHPVNSGALCARGQASLQGLYSPDRLRHPLARKRDNEQTVSWDEAVGRIADVIRGTNRRGDVVLLTGRQGPSTAAVLETWIDSVDGVRWISYDPFQDESLRAAGQIAFGHPHAPVYKLSEAEYILSFGADFLGTWGSPVLQAREYAGFRSKGTGSLIQAEPRLSLTGASADEWLRIRPGTEALFALTLLNVIMERGWHGPLGTDERSTLTRISRSYTPDSLSAVTGLAAEKIHRVARDFAGARPALALSGGSITGGCNAGLLDVVVLLLNYACGYIGKTVIYVENDDESVSGYGDLVELAQDMDEGKVELLLVSGINPVFFLPDSLDFTAALEKVKMLVSHNDHGDETAFLSDIVLPASHFLERWDDWAGVHGRSVLQPVMNPLYDTKGLGDLILSLDLLTSRVIKYPDFQSFIKEEWSGAYTDRVSPGGLDEFWEEVLRRGGLFSRREERPVKLSASIERDLPAYSRDGVFEKKGDERHHLIVYPSLYHFDGRGANKPWLQEVPDPLTQVVWDDWVEISREDAGEMGIEKDSIVRISNSYGSVELPAILSDGLGHGVIGVPFGQGHQRYGRYASGVGRRVQALLPDTPEQSSGALIFSPIPVNVTPTGRSGKLVAVQGNVYDQDRGILNSKGGGEHGDMYPRHPHHEYRWAMAIDLDLCTGCGACVVACYAENNIPVVGKEQVAKGREMSWVRVEKYLDENQGLNYVPMMCQQCDYAPCESVCPVHATYHNPQGLNAQIYNRCVGTRYCANNCPYKARRFNWFTYTVPDPLTWQLNPDISVREKGVMEKCTFCVQRIREGLDRAKDEGRFVADGEVVTACAQTCPTGAIVFGNIKDPESRVSKLSNDKRSYRILEVLNTKPAIHYLTKTRGKSGDNHHA